METYSILYSLNLNTHNTQDPIYEEIIIELLDTEQTTIEEAADITIEALQEQIINGADIVSNQTGEVFLTFKDSIIPTYISPEIQ